MAKKKAAKKPNGRLTPREEVLVNTILQSRSNFASALSMEGDNRDINAECGYPATTALSVQKHFKPFYDRHSIASRVVDVMPDECWRVAPTVFEDQDPDSDTEFEKAWKDLNVSLSGNSHFKQNTSSPIWEAVKRADKLSGIGRFGVVFLGLNDGLEAHEEAVVGNSMELLYLRVFDESCVEVSEWENDRGNPRYGHPKMYSITFSSPENASGAALDTETQIVHHTRCVHVVENIGSNEVFGSPRMLPVFNRLWDLRKLYGGSAEMYWKGAFPGYTLESHPNYTGGFDRTAVRDAMQDFSEGLQRYLALEGGKINSLSPQVVDPTPQINTQIEAICIQLGIPKRVFTGSERGELASTQDSDTWEGRVRNRRETYLAPRLIVKFVDTLINLGILPEPKDGYGVEWPAPDKDEDQGSSIALKQTEAMAKYVAGDVEAIMHPIDFLTRIIGFEEDEAQAIMEKQEEVEDEPEEGLGREPLTEGSGGEEEKE